VDVATLITRSRERARLSQRELAARAQTSAAAVCLYEQGERVPRVDTLARILAAMDITLELDAIAPAETVDVVDNGRTLEQLLELADNLPQRSSKHLEAPVFREMAR
jgi:transcriptional regulator with XRE-family HTH domain